MRLFGLYKGHVYFIDTVSTAQGFCQYRDISPIIGYGARGFTMPLNNVNIQPEPTPPPSWFSEMSPMFRGSCAITVDLNGDVIVQNKWSVADKESRIPKMVTRLFEYGHGNINVATNQWYSNENTIVNPFVAMLKYYNPEVIDSEFISKIRFIEEMHEYLNVYSIPFDKFMEGIIAFYNGTPVSEIINDWSLTTINKPVVVVDIKLEDIPEFSVSEIVYWNTWLKEPSEHNEQKQPAKEEASNTKPVEKKPRLVEDTKPAENVA